MSQRSAAPLFAALADETRLALVDRLCRGGAFSITRLTAGTGISRQAVTKHLVVLAGAGLVQDGRRGRERVWSLDRERLAEARRTLALISEQWDLALDRLRSFVETDVETEPEADPAAAMGAGDGSSR